MPVPTLSITSTTASSISDTDVLVLGVRKTEAGPQLLSDDPAFDAISAALPHIGATGAADELRRLPAVEGSTVPIALIGLGKDVTTDSLRAAAGAASRQLTGIDRITFALPVA